ncbi:MAG TPA: hypothetical protein VFZ36_07185 [Vicinamibacterales bacterium]
MDGDRLDLTPLDPTMDEQRWERMIGGILMRARPELTRRAARAGLLGVLGDWLWPALSAAALAAVVSGAVLAQAGSRMEGTMLAGGVVPALGLAEPVSVWLDEGGGPEVSDLIVALEGEGR